MPARSDRTVAEQSEDGIVNSGSKSSRGAGRWSFLIGGIAGALVASAGLAQPLAPPPDDAPAREGDEVEGLPPGLRPAREDSLAERAARIREARANRAPTPVIGNIKQPPGQPVSIEEQLAQEGAQNQTGNNNPQIVPGAQQAPEVSDSDEVVELSAFSEGVDLKVLIAQIASILHINISVAPGLEGKTIELNAPIAVRKDELLGLLDALLEQHGFAITLDPTGFYLIRERASLPSTPSGLLATTKIIETPNVRPSALQAPIQQILGTAPQGGAGSGSTSFIDELGVIVVTDTPRNIARVEEIVKKLLARRDQMKLYRIPLEYVAAPVARERALALAGALDTTSGASRQITAIQALRGRNQGQDAGNTAGSGSTLDNIGDRLGISPTGNSLVFNGIEIEVSSVRQLIEMIDVPETLEPKRYQAGRSARQIAEIASERGLGQIRFIEDETSSSTNNGFRFGNQGVAQNPFQTSDSEELTGGSVMVVDEAQSLIIYYGTPSQQKEMAALLAEMDTDADRIVVRNYRLNNADAEEVQTVIESLLTGQTQSDNTLLPTGQQQTRQTFVQQNNANSGDDDEIGAFDPDRAFVVADVSNNQIIVKAPKKQQDDFAKLIRTLDLRRPQVYLEAKIVSVSKSKDFQLAVESQLSAGQAQFQTNFGLTSAGDTFTDPRSVIPSLSGFTAAVIKSDYLPFVINALQTDTDARILSSPQLLVNDNEEASIVSLEEQPTTTTSQGGDSTVTGFDGFQEAGTRLNVTPSIADAGFLRLEYEVELSNFVGTGSNGVPAPRQTRTVNGLVTIPSDATIVVGGITVNNLRKTVAKIPLLGDIPLLGVLFQDRGEISDESLLYIFITPRIMTDPNFRDIKLFTEGPQGSSGIDPRLPPMEPEAIEFRAPPGAVMLNDTGSVSLNSGAIPSGTPTEQG